MKPTLIFIFPLILYMFLPIDSEAQLRLALFSKQPSNHPSLKSAIQLKPLRKSFAPPTLFENDFPKVDHSLLTNNPQSSPTYSINTSMLLQKNDNHMISHRRLKYSSLWAFTCLNYLYADLVGLMDMNYLNQYQTGVVNGIEITPGFLTAAAAYMQIPLSNVFLPQVIKNERTLRWVQIISGSIATLAQGATLFVGKPAPYYLLFSAIEMGVTAYITIDAIRWKVGKKRK